jgi:hypothetical protein
MIPSRPSVLAGIAAVLFAMGLLVGLMIGRSSSSTDNNSAANAQQGARSGARSGASDTGSAEETTRLVLGDIAAVPFQELYSVLSSRPQAELMAVAEQLKALPAGHAKDQKIANFFKAWAHFDPAGAMKSALAFDTPLDRSKAMNAVVEAADSAAGELLANTINQVAPESLPPNTQRRLVGQAAAKWSEIDAPAAAHFMDTIASSATAFFPDLRNIAANWAASDPQAALAWAQERDASTAGAARMATNGAISGWWQKDPAAAEAYVASHLNTLTDRQMALTLASQIFQIDPRRAMDWVNSLPDIEARRQADSLLANQMSWTDPKAAADWAAHLPDDVRSSALSSTISIWSMNNPAAAAEWLGTLNGAVRDQAVSDYSSAVSRTDPINALNWAAAISDPRTRDTRTEAIIRSWMQRSPADAQAWLQTSALAEDTKKRLLASVPPPPGG